MVVSSLINLGHSSQSAQFQSDGTGLVDIRPRHSVNIPEGFCLQAALAWNFFIQRSLIESLSLQLHVLSQKTRDSIVLHSVRRAHLTPPTTTKIATATPSGVADFVQYRLQPAHQLRELS